MVTARQVTTKEDKWNGERQKRVRTGCWRRRSRGRGRRCGLRPPGSSSSRSRRWGAERAVSSCSGGRRRANPIPLSSCSAANGAITENAPVDGQKLRECPMLRDSCGAKSSPRKRISIFPPTRDGIRPRRARALLSSTPSHHRLPRHEFLLAAVAGIRRGVRVLPPLPARFGHCSGEERVLRARAKPHDGAPLPPDCRAQVRCFIFVVLRGSGEASTEALA